MSDISIGPYTAGEVPPPLVYTFLDADGDPIALNTGFTGVFRFGRRRTTDDIVERTADVADDETGSVTFTWVDGDLDVAGLYVGEFWVTSDANEYASERIAWRVRRAVPQPA